MTSRLCKLFTGTILALGALASVSSTPAFAAEKPLEVYAELARTASVSVSPDGKRLAFLSPYKGGKGIFIYPLDGSKPKVLPNPEGARLKGIGWGSNDHLIFIAQFNRRGGGKMTKYGSRFTRTMSLNVNTGKSVILMNDKLNRESSVQDKKNASSTGSFMHILPNEPNKILMRRAEYTGNAYTRAYKVDLDTGKSRKYKTFPIETGSILTSPDGEDVLARTEYDRKTGKYKVFSRIGTDEKKVYEQVFDTSKNPTLSAVSVLPGSGKILMYDSETPDSRASEAFFTIDPATGSKSSYNFGVALPTGYDFSPVSDPHTDDMIGIGYTDDHYKTIYTAEPYKSWQSKLKKTFPGKRVSILSRTEDNSAVTIYVTQGSEPGEYFLFEPGAGTVSTVGKQYPELSSADIGRTIRVDYTARDGLKIPAYLTLPTGKSQSQGPFPLVVMPHGGPLGPRDNAGFDFWAQFIANRGYAVFKPQFRGSGGFGYDHLAAGYGEFGGGMVEDSIDGVRNLIDRGLVDENKICVTGGSYGGYQALQLPVVEPDMFKCAIAVNGVSDIVAILKFESARSGGQNSGVLKFWNRVIGDYNKDRDKMRDQSPINHIDKLKAEVLVVHGEDDLTVPYEQAEIMAKGLKKLGQSGKIIELKNDDHNLTLAESRRKLLQVSEELFAKHLD